MRKIPGFLAALLLLQYSAISTAAVDPLTALGGVADFPDYRVDTSGNLHLVWHDASVDSGAIFYKMRNSAGTDLIPALQVNTGGTGNANTWPAISVINGLVYIVWQNMDDSEVWFMRIDPSLAPLDGTATTAGTIREVELPISTAGGADAIHPRIRGESDGDLHVVWESTGGTVEYVKIDTDGGVINGPLSLGGAASGADLPDVDVDTNGDAHVVFGSNASTTTDEIYYAMVDGAAGGILIDATLLSTDDGLRAGNVTVNVDAFDDSLYIVYKRALMNVPLGSEEVFLARLTPAADDQDGSAASPAAIMGAEHQVTKNDGLLQWSVTSRIGLDKRIHATYIDYDSATCPATPYTVIDAHITLTGKVIKRDTLTMTGSASSCFPQARLAPGRNRIVWSDSTTPGISEILSDTFVRVQTGSSGFACSLGSRDAVAWRSGDLWLLLGMFLLAVRRFYRSR